MRGRGEVFGYLGLLLLAGAGLVRILFRDSGPAALGLAALGVALFLVYFFRSGGSIQHFLTRRSTREGGGALGTIVFVLGIAVLLNILASQFHAYRDVTADRIFTLAPETRAALAAAPSTPRVWVFYPPGDPNLTSLRSLMEAVRLEFPAVEYQVVDPERDPVPARRLGVREYSTVVEVGDRHESFTGFQEEEFLAALARASRTQRVTVAFLRGHGESLPTDRSPQGMAEAGGSLFDRGYRVINAAVEPGHALRDSADVLVLAGPQVSPTTAEMDSLLAFLDGGGRLLVFLDPNWPVTLAPLLDRVGLGFDPRFLSNPEGREPAVIQPAEYSTHPVVRALRSRRIPVVLRGAGEVDIRRRGLPGVRQAMLMRAGPQTVVADDPDSAPLSRGLAAAAEWEAPGDRVGRLVVVGDADLVLPAMYPVLGNGDFFLGAVQWLAAEERAIELRPRARTSRPLVLSRQQGRALMVLGVGLLPVLVLALGTVAWWRRR